MINEDLIAKLRAVKVPTKEEIMAKYNREFSAEDILNGRVFYSVAKNADGKCRWIDLGVALQEALEYVGDEGIVATMPELIAAKCRANDSHELWQTWYATHSEENIGIDQEGRFYSEGEPVLVVVHGGGLLTSSRIQQACDGGLIGDSAKYTQEEFDALLRGELPDDSSLELYSYGEIEAGVSNLPRRFGVVMPYSFVTEADSGYQEKKTFLSNPLVIARNAGRENLEKYFDLARQSKGRVASYHLYSGGSPTQSQGILLALNRSYDGLNGISLGTRGRFIGVTREVNRE